MKKAIHKAFGNLKGMDSNLINQEHVSILKEVEAVTLAAFESLLTSNSDNIQNQLKELESSIQDLKEGLESLSRRLIKAGVSLLNILNY
ncbi:hypothetical protein WN944_028401 [Citrus x changshan-huyou]|uniref:Uncharacterized protein n=1 Tax=Citrus x changshan-huyou TaxID=2935761 RepID=A0AAP0LQN5_9ROSI